MTSSLGMNRYLKDGLIFAGVALLLVATLPLLALVSMAGRLLLPVALVAVVLSSLFVPRMRRWLLGDETELVELHEGLRIPAGLLLSPAHAWARMTSRREALVGADDLVSAVLGPIDEVRLPAPGTKVRRGEPLFTLRRAMRSLSVRSPISGTVVATNRSLAAEPGLVNAAPYARGWAVRVEADEPGLARRSLLRGRDARVFFRHEVDRLIGTLSPAQPVPTLQDGGPFVGDLHARIDGATWKRLEAEFFSDDET